jgi:hypothetical protein
MERIAWLHDLRCAMLTVCLGACSTTHPPAAAKPRPATLTEAAALTARQCAPAHERPTRDAFFSEVLTAKPSQVTPLFDDYTPDSYHIDKLDVAKGLPLAAAACGVKLRALVLVGPAGMLWSYHVAALLEEGDVMRVNSLVMPHARITGKGTGILQMSEAMSMLRDIEQHPLVRSGLPGPPKGEDNLDFSYRLLLVVYGDAGAQYFHADFNEMEASDALSALLTRINAVLGKTASTYRTGDIKRQGSATMDAR